MRLRPLLTALLLLLPVVLVAPAAAAAPVDDARGARPVPYALLQMNLCLSGLAGCFGGTQYPAVVDEAVERIRSERPDAVTLNEACSGDVDRIAEETGLQVRFATVVYRGAPLPCVRPEGRGVFGNAVLTRSAVTGSEDAAFAAQSGVEERRWLCVTTEDDVRVCTTHLSVAGSPEQQAANEAQCRELRDLLASSRRQATIFAGDVNRRASCAPAGSWTLRDSAARQAPGIQHAYGSRAFLVRPVAEVVPMVHTDHDALVARAGLRG